jgi:hypothetical protein
MTQWTPPDPEPHIIRHIDFSEFHPFDHRAWSRRCFNTVGGPRRHMSLWALASGHDHGWFRFLMRLRWCMWGKHVYLSSPIGEGAITWTCQDCGKVQIPSEKELEELRRPFLYRPE